MIKNDRLNILSATEQFAFYGLPDFDNKQRQKYFSFSANEMKIIMRSSNLHLNIYCALQIGYFKAKKLFFNIIWEDIIPEDLQFIIDSYFPDITLTSTKITKYEYYNKRQEISIFFGYKLWSKEFLSLLYEESAQIIKRDTSPNFIALQLLSFLNDIKIVRPGYTTLQSIVSSSLTNERNRISNILDHELTEDYKLKLDNLIASDSSLSKLASFKQDAKNFGFKMMLKEREKHNILESLYTPAKNVIKKLNISQRNINNYVDLANHYNIRDLRELKHNQNYLYLLCYIFKRYQQLNDNLIEAFIYHTKKLDNTIKDKVKIHFVDNITDSQEKIANLLLLYVDDKFDDTVLFSKVRNKAFKIMSKEDIQILGQKMLTTPNSKKEIKWQEIDKAQRIYKKNIRPLFMKLNFSSELSSNPWIKSVDWLQNTFINRQKLSDKSFSECPNDTIPKNLQRYLIENNNTNNQTINGNRYEYWTYCQIVKQITTGGIYIEDSFNHRCFNHELASIDQKKEILNKLNIPWFQQPIEIQLDYLSKELHNLWVSFNKNLKQNNFTHLKYDYNKQKLCTSKIKVNKDEYLQSKFFQQLPFCEINDVLHFVNNDCNFLSAFIPLQPRYSKQDSYINDKLIATILAQAFNHGNYKMSQISNISYQTLETTYQQYLRLSTLRNASDILTNNISKLPIFPYYSLDLELLYSSVDGQKFQVDTPNIKARYSRKYLREGQGVSAYTILANHIPLQCELIGSHEHESYFVFDIWYNNTTEIIPEVITGDMHVVNKANFAISNWFGVHLKPRFTDLNQQLKHLYCSNDIKIYADYLIKPVDQIDQQLILGQKNGIDQIVATLASKEISQSNLIKKLCQLPPGNSLRKAIFEYDKLIRSIYTLKYMMNHQLQKTVHKSQNRIESYHQLRAAIAKVGGKKQLYGKTEIDVEIANQCGRLVALVIIYYNSLILSAVLEKYPDLVQNKKSLAMMKKISPVAWHYHIHFLGQYNFQNKNNILNINEILKNINIKFS